MLFLPLVYLVLAAPFLYKPHLLLVMILFLVFSWLTFRAYLTCAIYCRVYQSNNQNLIIQGRSKYYGKHIFQSRRFESLGT